MTPETGAYPNMPATEYHALDAASNSRLTKLDRSGLHLWHELNAPHEPTPAMIKGTGTHCAVLEPDKFEADYCRTPNYDKRTKEGKALHAAFLAEFAGRTALDGADFDACCRMRDAVHAHPAASEILKCCHLRELSLVWDCALTQVRCKARLDALGDLDEITVVDLKTTKNAHPDEFPRSIWSFGYYRQGPMYLDGYNEVNSLLDPLQKPARHFLFIAVESEPPHAVAIYRLKDEVVDAGRGDLLRLKAKYKQVREEWQQGIYRGYGDEIMDVGIPLRLTQTWNLRKGRTNMSTAVEEVEVEALSSGPPAIVSGFGSALPTISDSGTTAIAVREDTEIKTALVMARQFPRTEEVAYAKLIKSCSRATFAESAVYAFPRGGTTVKGPSVDLAREAARVWGNIRYGLRIVSVDDDQVHIRGYALDMESNSHVEAEDRFAKLVERKGKGWIKPDERDLRELVNRRGAILVRNCILQLLPPDVIDDAVRQVNDTMRKAANGEITQSMEEARRRLVMSFERVGVTVEMLEKFLKHKLDVINGEELAELRQIGKSIADGNSRREEHFEFGTASTAPASDATQSLNAKLKGAKKPVKAPELTESQQALYDTRHAELKADGYDDTDAHEMAFTAATKVK